MQRTKTSREAKAHYAAIDAIVDRWHNGDLGKGEEGQAEKQRLIAEENRFYHGREQVSPVTHKLITQPGADVLLPTIDKDDEEQEELWYQKM